MKGIDVSVHNGKIDWQKVKESGVQFVIIRAGYGKVASQKDKRFEENYAGAKAVGLPIGAYWYSYAKTVDEVKQEAAACIEVLKGKQFEFPIWFDQEEKSQFDTGKANCSAMVRAFCNALEAAGYWVGLYTSRSILGTHIEDDIKTRYALWVAEWGLKLNYSGAVGMWQLSSNGVVPGITGNVDLDTSYVDYPAKIKAAGRNGFAIDGDTIGTEEVIKLGDKGGQVVVLQTALTKLGYLRAKDDKYPGEIDGHFGRITLSGVCGFQFEHGLTVNGKCDAETQKAINAALKEAGADA